MQQGHLFVDHVFMLVNAAEVDKVIEDLGRLGLTESSRRAHVGLGTANVFYCFDNIFLEILWIVDRDEAGRSALGRQLLSRLDWREHQATPFGIGFRTRKPDDEVPFDTWGFLPPSASGLKPVPIARSSDDLAQPLLFRAQRVLRPDQWVDGKAGTRQTKAGLADVTELRFKPPEGVQCSRDVDHLHELGILDLAEGAGMAQMTLSLSRTGGQPAFELQLQSPQVQLVAI